MFLSGFKRRERMNTPQFEGEQLLERLQTHLNTQLLQAQLQHTYFTQARAENAETVFKVEVYPDHRTFLDTPIVETEAAELAGAIAVLKARSELKSHTRTMWSASYVVSVDDKQCSIPVPGILYADQLPDGAVAKE